MFIFFRDGLDRKCAYFNRCNWIWCSLAGMGHRSTWLDRWSCSDVLVLFCHLLLYHSSQWLLQNRRSCFRKEKLYLHGCCPINSRYYKPFIMFYKELFWYFSTNFKNSVILLIIREIIFIQLLISKIINIKSKYFVTNTDVEIYINCVRILKWYFLCNK